MDKKDFQALRESIEQRTLELTLLQELYVGETGRQYIPLISSGQRKGKKTAKDILTE